MIPLLTGPWIVAFLAFSVITFVSYQMIPHNLDALDKRGSHGVIGAIVSSKVFTMFVRWCGMDHMVMAWGMLSMAIMMGQGNELAAQMIARIIVVSAGGVSLVSALSAIAIYNQTRQKS